VERQTIRILLLHHGLKPWREKNSVYRRLHDECVEKMEDVLEVRERPYDAAEPVVCLAEKPVTLHADIRPACPAVPGREARWDGECERCGTANTFCAVEPKAGRPRHLSDIRSVRF
jgi:hypothetical protein